MTLAGQAVLVVVLLLTQQTIISFTNCAPNVNNDESIFYLAQIDSVLDYVKRADRVDFTFHKLVHAEEKDDLTYIDLEVVKHCPPEQTVCVTHLLRCLAQVRYDPSSRTYNTLPNIYCDENVTHDEQETTTAGTTTTTTPQTATEQKEIEEEKVIKARVNDCLGCMVELNKNVEGSQILVDTAMHHIKSERDQFHVPLRILKLERQIVAGVKYSLLLEIAPTICSVTYMLQNCPVSENHEPEICRVVFLEKPWINKEKHIISNNCTVSQDFAPSKQSPNDLDNEIDINNDYRDTRPENYDENVSDKKPNFDMMAESGSIVDEAARLAELEAQIVSSPDIQPKKVNPIHATRTPVEDSEAGVEDIPVVRTTTTVNANPKESKSTQELFKVLLDGYHEVLGSDPFFWEMFSKWTPNGIVERFRREVRLGAPSSALGDPMVTELAKSTLQLLDGESSHEQKYKIKEITEATKQVVSGFKYIIKANVVLSDCAKSSKEDPDLCGEHPSKVNKACVFDIWSQPWLPEGRKTEVKCGAETYKFRTRRSVIHEDSKSSESDETHAKNKKKDKSKSSESSEEKGVTEEAIRVKRERLIGAPEGLETSDPKIQELTKSTLTYFDKRTTHDTKYKILNIRKASSQVVSGALYKITADIVLSDCPKSSNTDSSLCGVHPTKLQKTCDIRIWDQPWLPQGRKTNITCGTDTYSFRTDSTKHNKDSLKLTKKKREAVDDLQNLLVETELPQGSSSSSEEKKTNIRKRNVHDHSTSSSEEKKTLKLKQNKKEAVDDLKNLLVEKDVPQGSSSSSEEKKTIIRKRNVHDHSTSSSEEKKTLKLKQNKKEAVDDLKNLLVEKDVPQSSSSSSEEKKTNIRKRNVHDHSTSSSEEKKTLKNKKEAVDDLKNLLVEKDVPQGSSSSSEEKKTNIRKRNVHDHSTSSSEEKKTLKLKQNKKEAVDDLKNLLVEKDVPQGSSSSSEEKKTNIRKRNVHDHSTSSSEEKKTLKNKKEAVDDLKNLLVEKDVPQGSSSSSEEKKTNIRKRNVHDHSTSSSEEKKTLKLKQNKKEAVDDLKNLLVEKDLPQGSSSSSEEKKTTNIRKRNVNDHSTSSSEEKKTSNIRKRSVDDGDSASSSEELQDYKMKNEEKNWNRFPFLPVSSIIARRKGSKTDEDVDSISSLNSEDTFDRSKRAVTDRNNDSSSSSSSSSSDDDDNNDNTNKEKRTSKKASYKEEKKKDDKNDSSSSSSSSDDDNGNGNRRHKRNLDEHDEKALIARLAKIAAESLNDANNKNQVLEILRVNKLELEGAVYFLSARLGVGHCSGVESCLIDEEKLCKFKVHVSKNLEHVKVVQTHCHKIEKDSDKNRTNRRDKRQPVDKKTMQHVELFKTFVKEHRKFYKSYTDFQLRLKIFLKNMKTIETLNREEQGTAVYGPTKFADLTRKEFEQYLGYREDLRHENDISYSDAVIPDIELPESVDWREKKVVTHVKDQKQCGSCWAFSVTGNVEGQYAIKHGELLELSEQELVDCDEYDSGCNGGLMDNAYRAVEQLGGLETEDDYPYRADDEKCHFNKTLAKVRLSGAVNISQDESDMAKWLTQNGPMAIALNANAMQFYMGGVSHPMKFLCNPTALDHGVLIVGFGTHSKYDNSYPKFNKTLPYWIIKNSWGPKWGEQGYYRVYRGDGTCGVNQMVSSAIVE